MARPLSSFRLRLEALAYAARLSFGPYALSAARPTPITFTSSYGGVTMET
jgi:hypothetical protein